MSMAINGLTPDKCPAKPSKRRWGSIPEAWEAADRRSEEVGLEIVPYRCDSCGFLHLTKRMGGTSEVERVSGYEIFVPTNTATRRAALKVFLDGKNSVTTEELMGVLNLTRGAVGKYMIERGWRNTLGRSARWVLDQPVEPAPEPHPHLQAVEKRTETPIDMAKRRHPSSKDVGWRPVMNLDRIRHMAIGDLIETLEAVGLEFRLMTREKN